MMFVLAYAYPVTDNLMNWNSVILVGVVVLTSFWWAMHGIKKYPGPKLAKLYTDAL